MAQEPKENQLNLQQKYFICHECCFWVTQLIIVLLGLTIMSRTIIGFQNTQAVITSTQYAHSLETVWLWQQGYIIDIRVENTNNCPQGYIPLINYQWSGTLDGCHCKSTANNYTFEFVLLGKCSSQLISMNCETISSLAAQTLNMWKGSQLICYKRAQSMNFYNSILTTAPTGGSSATMTTCSNNQIYQVYTLPGVACPITAVSNSTLGGSQTTMILDEVHNYNLNFIAQTGYPIANFKLTQYQFCDFFNVTNISPNKHGTYILQNHNINEPCPLTDSRMIKIDSLNQQDFYTNNTRVYQLISSLPAYPKPSVDYIYQLGYIPYPSWTYQCRISSKFDLYTTTTHLLFQNALSTMVLSVSLIVPCSLVLVIIFRIFYLIRHIVVIKSRKTYNALMLTQDQIIEQIPTIDIKKSFKKQLILFLLQLLLILAIFFGLVYSIYTLTKDSIWIKQIIKNQCTDSYLNQIFLYYQYVIDKTANILLEMTFVWMFLLIVHISYFVVRTQIGDLYFKKEYVEVVESVSEQPMKMLEKQGKIQGISMQDSSEIVLNKQNNSQLKIYDMQYMMGDGAGQTKDNFFGSLQRQASINVVKKKKKKKPSINKKKKNLFKEDQM